MSLGMSLTHSAGTHASRTRRRIVAAACTAALAVGVVVAGPRTSAAAASPVASVVHAAVAASSTRGGVGEAPEPPAVVKRQRAAGTDRSTYFVELTGTSVGTTFAQEPGQRHRAGSSGRAGRGDGGRLACGCRFRSPARYGPGRAGALLDQECDAWLRGHHHRGGGHRPGATIGRPRGQRDHARHGRLDDHG